MRHEEIAAALVGSIAAQEQALIDRAAQMQEQLSNALKARDKAVKDIPVLTKSLETKTRQIETLAVEVEQIKVDIAQAEFFANDNEKGMFSPIANLRKDLEYAKYQASSFVQNKLKELAQ